jgi:hypothetical protein
LPQAPSRSRDGEGKIGTHFSGALPPPPRLARASKQTTTPGEPPHANSWRAGECRVAIAPMTLHKRGWLNNQSSNALEAVVGYA